MKKQAAIELVEKPSAICQDRLDYTVMFHGQKYGELYFNMRGYTGINLPMPNGAVLEIGERSISAWRSEIRQLNKEFAGADRLDCESYSGPIKGPRCASDSPCSVEGTCDNCERYVIG